MRSPTSSDALGQEIELQILQILARFVEPSFIDVGTEKGSFARVFIEQGLTGFLFEPFPEHAACIEELIEGTSSRFFPWAVADRDHTGTLHLAVDEDSRPLDHFHSLLKIDDHSMFTHSKTLRVTCRSLGSLVNEGTLPKRVGILKVDTEGNDEAVLEGLRPLRPQVLICEYLDPALYPGWNRSRPESLIELAAGLGLTECLAVKRMFGTELVVHSPTRFPPNQWGNLIFAEAEVMERAARALQIVFVESAERLLEHAGDLTGQLEAKEECLQGLNQQLLEKEALIGAQAEEADRLRTELARRLSTINTLSKGPS